MKTRTLLAAFAALFICSVPLHAQTIWIDATGDWSDSTNWSAGVPTAATDAEINNGGTAVLDASSMFPVGTVKNLYLGSGTAVGTDVGTVNVDGIGSLAGAQIVVGRGMAGLG